MKSPLLELGSHVSLRDANGEINPTVLYIDVMLHDEDTISSVISLYWPSVYLKPPPPPPPPFSPLAPPSFFY